MRLSFFLFISLLLSTTASGIGLPDLQAPYKSNITHYTISYENDDELISSFQSIGSVNSLLIEINGEIILERYFGGMNASRATNTKSASKSILSLLIGIAIDKGYISSVNQTLDEFFPEYFESNPDPVKASITIRDMLTMRTGIETTSFHNYGRWVVSPDWATFALNQPMESEPGSDMIYSTGTSHLLSVILTKSAGMSTLAFANRYMFRPMDITVGGWDRDPQGYYMGGNNMALRPADMLKIGRMVLNGGIYNGNQIVSENCLNDSFQIYTRSNFNPYDYGYMWWSRETGGYDLFFAWGHGGQYIMMIPKLDAVITITSNLANNDGSRRYQQMIFDWMEEYMIAYLENHSSTVSVR
jgi:CubicO group peptidase (beta-lactamase class C family)